MFARVKSIRTFALVSAVALVGAVNASPATAASGPGGVTISCTAKFNNPHNSGHKAGTVNASVDTWCTAPVGKISSFFSIRDLTNSRRKNTGGNTTYATRSNCANAALSCKNGIYQGGGTIQIQFPPGFKPNFQSKEGVSKALPIACNSAARSLSLPSPDEIAALEEAYGPNVEVLPDGSIEVTITATAG